MPRQPRDGDRMLVVEDLAKKYGSIVALAGASLTIDRGEILCLLGPNGAGKTTLVSIIAGLTTADSGRVTLDGVDALRSPRAARGRLGLASQDIALYPSLTVVENLKMFGRLADLRGPELKLRINEVLTAFDLDDKASRPTRALSGGEQRRVHTAAAVLHEPPLLLLDEPTAGVDVVTRQSLLDLVKRLASTGAAIAYLTHYFPEVETLDGNVAVLHHGKVLATGSVGSLLEEHGAAAVELDFDGEAPAALNDLGFVAVDGGARLACRHPASELVRIVTALGDGMQAFKGIRLVEPSLDTVFMSITGRSITDPLAHEKAS